MFPANYRVKKAFTLLELIVVIIIIGVLGTIGFVQYDAAIWRSKTAEAIIILGSIRKAQEGYYLEYGIYAGSISSLSLDVNNTKTKYFNFTAFWNGTSVAGATAKFIPDQYADILLYINANGTIGCNDDYRSFC